jgi:ABC-2 type transport system ATP-binding protein
VITVPDADAFMAALCRLREELGFKILKVSTEAPSIEEVFIELTGKVPEEGACGCGRCPL